MKDIDLIKKLNEEIDEVLESFSFPDPVSRDTDQFPARIDFSDAEEASDFITAIMNHQFISVSPDETFLDQLSVLFNQDGKFGIEFALPIIE